jgi:hypothetical protein
LGTKSRFPVELIEEDDQVIDKVIDACSDLLGLRLVVSVARVA